MRRVDGAGVRAVGFEDTRWSLVLRAGSNSEEAAEAMASLCQQYWPPLYSFLRARGYSQEDASDVLQGFFLKVIEKDTMARARPELGRFRTFLLTALTRYAANDYARQTAIKRGGRTTFVRLDVEDAERLHRRIPGSAQTPEGVFERQWAHGILSQAIERLRETYKVADNEQLFAELHPNLATPGEASSYRESAERLGMSEGAVRVAVHRMKGKFRDAISEVVSETVASPEDVDDEIRYLIEVLGRGNHV